MLRRAALPRSSGQLTPASKCLPGAAAALAVLAAPAPAWAAALDGASMGWPWALPFAGILLSIALGPLLFARIWHHHYGKIAGLWALLTVAALALVVGPRTAVDVLLHAMLAEYLSFIVLLFALYVVAGGILITGDLRGTPVTNVATLLIGTVLASVVGTTGAAMILIRPLIRANAERRHNVHVIIFFIFLVANVGGALSPLGDPPLFVGFLRGVDFFWTTRHLLLPTVVIAALLLALFLVLDLWRWRNDPVAPVRPAQQPLRIRGLINLPLIAVIIGTILLSAWWRPGISLVIGSTMLELQNLLRDAALIALAVASLKLTPEEHREANDFSFEPIREVAKLFAAIFVCISPVLAMLQAGSSGSFAVLLRLVTEPDGSPREAAYFWLTGLLSAVLDNAPTYLVFFELAGGDPQELMGPLAPVLAAISMGAVYLGAMTYIGNAPNFMVYAIAQERGVAMPSFFGFLAWSAVILLPVVALAAAFTI
jgi:Na+/H+ antiporter NhaD/arsenite permease-like protein